MKTHPFYLVCYWRGIYNESHRFNACLFKQRLNSKARTALGTTSINYSTTAPGFHTNQKAVGTGTLDFGWLVSTFHGISLSLGIT
jgi:hypothetical protein